MREDFEYAMEDGTLCRFFGPMTLQETYADEEDGFSNHISYLPKNWKELKWWLIVQSPCLWGDDLRVALDDGRHYTIHDCVCEKRVLKTGYEDTVYSLLQDIAAGKDLEDEE